MSTAPFLAPGRDSPRRAGRLKSSGGTTWYTIPGAAGGNAGSANTTLANTYLVYMPWHTDFPIVVDQLACYVSTAAAAGKFLRIGFYAADTDFQPIGAPLADSGNIAADSTGAKTYTPSTPVFVPPGRYLSAVASDGTTGLRAWVGGPRAISSALASNPSATFAASSFTYAAFPTPGPTWSIEYENSSTGTIHGVVYRVSGP